MQRPNRTDNQLAVASDFGGSEHEFNLKQHKAICIGPPILETCGGKNDETNTDFPCLIEGSEFASLARNVTCHIN